MERIKHLLLLLVFLLGVTSVTAQPLRAPGDADINFTDVDIVIDDVALQTTGLMFTGCDYAGGNIEITVTLSGNTGIYENLAPPNTSYNGSPQEIPLRYRVSHSGGVDIFGLGAIPLADVNTTIDPERVTGGTGGVLGWTSHVELDPDRIVQAGTGTYTLEAYFHSDPTHILATSTFDITADYGVDLNMKSPWELMVGCVTYQLLDFEFGEFVGYDSTTCPNHDNAQLVIEYTGTGTDVDVLGLGSGSLEIDLEDGQTILAPPTAINEGSGQYSAYIQLPLLDENGTIVPGEFVRVSNIDTFTITAEYPYELTMEDWEIYIYENVICPDYAINPAFFIFGPDDAPGTWTANETLQFVFWSENGSEIFPALTAGNVYTGFNNMNRVGGYVGQGTQQSVARRNFPTIGKDGSETFKGQLVCRNSRDAVSEPMDFVITVKYPVEPQITGPLQMKVDPICPTLCPVTYDIDFTNMLCAVGGAQTPVIFEFEYVSGVDVIDNVTPASGTLNNKDLLPPDGLTTVNFTFTYITDGTGEYLLNVYYDGHGGDPDHLIGSLPVTFDITCADFDPATLTVAPILPLLPDYLCNDGTTTIQRQLTALYDYTCTPSGPGGPGGALPNSVPCPDNVGFVVEKVASASTLALTLIPADGVSGDLFEFVFTGHGKDTFRIYPVVLVGCVADAAAAAGDPSLAYGTPFEFTIDVRDPLKTNMLLNGGEIYYRENGTYMLREGGADIIIDLTNDARLPGYDPNNTNNVVMELWIEDPHGAVVFINDTPPTGYDLNYTLTGGIHYFTFTNIDATVEMPNIYLQNGTSAQIPLSIKYGLRYEDGTICCDPNDQSNIPIPPALNVCAVTEFFIVVNPSNTEINLDLMVNDFSATPICITDGQFDIQLNANYEGNPIDGNAALQSYKDDMEVTFRIDYVSGDEVIDVAAENAYLAAQPPLTYLAAVPVDWPATAAGTGKGVYLITPMFNNVMPVPMGVGKLFTLEVHAELAPEMIGLDGQNLVYNHGDVVSAISLDVIGLPSGAEVTWVLDNGSDVVGTAVAGNYNIPPFVAVNDDVVTFLPKTATYTATITYPNGGCPDAEATWTITVNPVIDPGRLIADHVDNIIVCEANNTIPELIIPSARYAAEPWDVVAPAWNADPPTEYFIEYVSGDDVAQFIRGRFTGNYGIKTIRPGKGTYQLVPVLLDVRGVPAPFTVEVQEPLDLDMVDLNGGKLVFTHLDPVESIYLTGNLPAGATVTWTWDNTSDAIGTAESGHSFVPFFVAQNTTSRSITAKYNFTISYNNAAGGCADAVDGTFEIEVLPNVVEDLRLAANPVDPQTICVDADFAEIIFSSTYVGDTDPPVVFNPTYTVEFVSGNAIIDLATQPVADKWTPVAYADATGTGIYRVVPAWNNGRGVAATFTLSIAPAVDLDMVGVNGAVFNYQNGDPVPAISLDTNLPAGATVTWTATGDIVGLNSTSGNAIVPSFVAVNPGGGMLTATIDFTISNGVCEDAEGSFTINVHPNTIDDMDLVMAPVATILPICNDPYNGFDEIEFEAYHNTVQPFTGNVNYRVEFVGGDAILDLTANYMVSSAAGTPAGWTPDQAYDTMGNPLAGTGYYRVTPIWNGNQGVPAVFALTVHPPLDNSQIDLQDNMGYGVEFVYENGDVVPELNLRGTKLPADITVMWEILKNQPDIGSTTSGVGRMPSFVARNTTNQPVTAEYIAWLKYDAKCDTKDNPVHFFITVNPKLIPDNGFSIKRPADQTICDGEDFENIILEAVHYFDNITLPIDYHVVFGSGDNVLGVIDEYLYADCNPYTWVLPKTATTGSGTYVITPIMDNYIGTPVEVTLTRLPAPTVNQVANFEICSGDPLYVEFTSNFDDNTIFNWTADTNTLGIPTSGSKFIDVAKVLNTTDEPKTITFKVTPLVPGTKCPGKIMIFQVTVNPEPTVNYVPNMALVHGTEVGQGKAYEIKFEGVATAYKWTSSNPTIYESLSHGDFTSGTVIATNGVAYMPDFTTANYTKEIITSTVTVTPYYNDCEGDPIQFHILVKSETAGIILESVKNVTICEGEYTEPISFGLPAENFYYITWSGGSAIGLDDNNGTPRAKNIPSFQAKVGTAVVTVIPHVRYNSVEFTGTPIDITFTVHPNFDLTKNFDGIEVINIEMSTCADLAGNQTEIRLVADVTDTKYAYQWYKDGVLLPGETSAIFTRPADVITLKDAGEYYCIISSKTGCANANGETSVRSKLFKVFITETSGNVRVEQLWSDVLQVNCIASENGGYTYTSYKWYKLDGTSVGNGKSWVQVPDINAQYYVVVIDTNGDEHRSCPITLVASVVKAPATVYVAPSPVDAGTVANVTVTGIVEGTIHIINSTGVVVKTAKMEGEITPVTMPDNTGIYFIQVIPADEGKAAKGNVIVK